MASTNSPNSPNLGMKLSQLHPHAYHLQLPPHHKLPLRVVQKLEALEQGRGNNDGSNDGNNKNSGSNSVKCAGSGGIPYITIQAQRKARGIWNLIKSIELTEALYLDDTQPTQTTQPNPPTQPNGATNQVNEGEALLDNADNTAEDVDGAEDVNGEDGNVGEEGEEVDDEDEEGEETQPWEGTTSMLSLVKKCSRLHTQLSSLGYLKHNGISQFELCQIILKVLTLLSATVIVEDVFEEENAEKMEEEIMESVSTMAIEETAAQEASGKPATTTTADAPPKRRRRRRVSLHFDAVGSILGGNFSEEELKDSMLKRMEDGSLVMDMTAGRGRAATDENDASNVADADSVADEKQSLPSTETSKHPQTSQELEEDLSRPLALPSPAREALLSVALLLLSKKDQLKSVSNAALYLDDEKDDKTANKPSQRWMLLLSHQSLLRMLLRTAPYLDEHKAGTPPTTSPSRLNSVLKSTVNLIRSCRRFFDQGIRPPGWTTGDGTAGRAQCTADATALSIWQTTQTSLLYHTHSNSCFRALIILYLFHPSKCSTEYYLKVMPKWMESWTSVDRCPEWDFLWMVMFGRARKYVVQCEGWDWGVLRRHLLTQCAYWLQIPVGGISADKSFPAAAPPNKRNFPYRLKAFVGSGSKYEEGIDFVGRLTKLLLFCAGPHGVPSNEGNPENFADDAGGSNGDVIMEGGTNDSHDSNNGTSSPAISAGTQDLLRYMTFVKPYLNPSNVGIWTFPLGAFLHYLSYELCHRVGVTSGLATLDREHPLVAKRLLEEEPYLKCIGLPGHEIVAFFETLVPLCQQALYSKNGNVSHAGESALLYLTQIDPSLVSPPLLDFSLQALGMSSVNLAHQAPAALIVMSRLLQPSLRRGKEKWLERIGEILNLTLMGIDSNDQNKTMRTLIFYRTLSMWIPCGGRVIKSGAKSSTGGGNRGSSTSSDESVMDPSGSDGTLQVSPRLMEAQCAVVKAPSYLNSLKTLPESSVLAKFQTDEPIDSNNSDNAVATESLTNTLLQMTDWSLLFLDRIYSILRTAGEQEKLGKGYGGVASRHTSADVAVTKNFSRVWKECLTNVFCGMDDECFGMCVRSVVNFVEEETLPFAAKDASLLCMAVGMTRFSKEYVNGGAAGVEGSPIDASPGFDTLLPILTNDLSHRSDKSAIYRLRCLSGLVRHAGSTVIRLHHKKALISAINYAMSKPQDKTLFKTGCKLLRHVMASQCETYPIGQCSSPAYSNIRGANGGNGGSNFSAETYYNLGTSAQLRGNKVEWHVPSGDQIDFVVELLEKFALVPLKELGYNLGSVDGNGMDTDSTNSGSANQNTQINLPQWRQCLRVLRYAIRGCSGILLDDDATYSPDTVDAVAMDGIGGLEDLSPYEKATSLIIQQASPSSKECLHGLRLRLCQVMVDIMRLVARDTANSDSNSGNPSHTVLASQSTSSLPSSQSESEAEPQDKSVDRKKNAAASLSYDTKSCKEVIEISSLLLTRRGAFAKVQSTKTIWSGQKEVMTDFVLATVSDSISSALYRANVSHPGEGNSINSNGVLPSWEDCYKDCYHYKDGENGGKTIPRALLVTRVNILLQTLQRNASFEIPRRLRKKALNSAKSVPNDWFSLDMNMNKLKTRVTSAVDPNKESIEELDPLGIYETLINGLFALSCHPNINVRANASGTVEYAMTRFPWIAKGGTTAIGGSIGSTTAGTKDDGSAAQEAAEAIVPYAPTTKHRITRLQRMLRAISLNDATLKSLYGLPSASLLTHQFSSQNKRTRLAEVVKGVAKLIANQKMMKELLSTEKNRFEIIKVLCQTQKMITLLPPEEVQKVVYYINVLFLNFRSRFFVLPRARGGDQRSHEELLSFLLRILSGEDEREETTGKDNSTEQSNGVATATPESSTEGDTGTKSDTGANKDASTEESDVGAMHWRNRLVVAWFLTHCIDEEDLLMDDPSIMKKIWLTCFKLIEEEAGQPLQRVALGLLGKLVFLTLDMTCACPSSENATKVDNGSSIAKVAQRNNQLLQAFSSEKFTIIFADALVHDHREDSSVGGGHAAQWSSGVEEILRDATNNLAPRTLFPFQRISQKSYTFKLAHAQLLHAILLGMANSCGDDGCNGGFEHAKSTSKFLFDRSLELVASPPSEDQRNQICTGAEIFGGVCRALIQISYTLSTQEGSQQDLSQESPTQQACIWQNILLPFLDKAIPQIPPIYMSAFFDAIRYGIHHFPPSFFFELLVWCVGKVKSTLWQQAGKKSGEEEEVEEGEGGGASSSALADRFALQSKWLFLAQSVIIELDSEDDLGAVCQLPWYTEILLQKCPRSMSSNDDDDSVGAPAEELGQSWIYVSDNLLPCLLNALSHPYEKCRDYLSSLLFRVCYCHRKFLNTSKGDGGIIKTTIQSVDLEIINQLCSIRSCKDFSFKDELRALSTARKFIACCVHWGDGKHEYSEYIIPLLPLAFHSLQTTEGEASPENRGIEAELIKGFRYIIADVSSSCVVSYGIPEDMTRVLDTVKDMAGHDFWQIRQAAAHFLRCFQGGHKFIISKEQDDMAMTIAINLLSDDRREVSNAAMSALTGILAAFPSETLELLVGKYIKIANKSLKKKKKKNVVAVEMTPEESEAAAAKEKDRAKRQQTSCFVLCAVVLGIPYDTPKFVPEALAALSKHSFEQRASLGVREAVKMCCSEFKRTHTDNWDAHKKQFSQEQLEAFEDVVSIPHYYA